MPLEIERRRQSQKWITRSPTGKNVKSRLAEATGPRRRADDEPKAKRPEAPLPRPDAEKQRLLTELQALTEANLDLEAFNYSVSHDLCTPLTAINGYCQVLREICKNQLDEQSMEYLLGIYEGTQRMKRIIVSMLEFSRSTGVPISRYNLDMSEMAREVAEELTLAAPERRVNFRCAEGITGTGDPDLVRTVLDNLIGNAWKHTHGEEEAVIEFGTTDLEGKPVWFVRDNGAGFDMALADQLFVPFQRIPGTLAKGHGIGLATVDRIVKRHGGRIWAESKPGEGAVFQFTLE